MHGDDGPGPPTGAAVPQLATPAPVVKGDDPLQVFGVHLPVHRLRVDEHWPRAQVTDGVGWRDEAEGGNENFIVRLNARYTQGYLQSRRTATAGHRMGHAHRVGHCPLETVYKRAA